MARFRLKVQEMMLIDSCETKYALFLDLKQAYPRIKHKVLYKRLKEKGFPVKLINTVKKIYNNAKVNTNRLKEDINLNRGMLTGGVCTPFLFNVVADSLVRLMIMIAFECIAYADDLVILCSSKEQLLKTIVEIQTWVDDNYMEINKKKSGILVLKNNWEKENNIEGYPIKSWYKYLGVRLDSNLSPLPHLILLDKKLKTYLVRNQWIIKKYFSARTLVDMTKMFQVSKIVYGMCAFLDQPKIIERVEKMVFKFLKSIIGLKENINNNKLRMTVAFPKVEFGLYTRLMKLTSSYKNHFNEECYIYNSILNTYKKWLNKDTNKLKLGDIKEACENRCLRQIAKEENIQVANNYEKTIRKNWYTWADRRERMVITYMCGWGFFETRLFPICANCGENNSRTHATNECTSTAKLRNEYLIKIRKCGGETAGANIEEMINTIMYNADPKWSQATMTKLVNLVKEFISSFYINNSKLKDAIENEKKKKGVGTEMEEIKIYDYAKPKSRLNRED